ncbi:MAG TPA: hypothetical protein VGR89_11715 [Puia sp.]|nr:hypothetical protein [Puia sp.]
MTGDLLAQSDEWHESENWRLYGIGVSRFREISLRSLGQYQSRPLNEDSMRAFMAHPTRIAASRVPRWTQAYVATCVLDEVKRKIDLSIDGSFFFDESVRAYYQVAPEIRQSWSAYLAACFAGLRPKE